MDSPSAGYTFEYLIETLSDTPHKKFFNVPKLGGTKYDILPYSIRVLLEAAVRNCDGFLMKKEDVMNILDWKTKQSNVEVPFFPARVVLQDFTGIPAMVDFAAMREAVKSLGGDPKKVHPACPTDLTVDHSLQMDFSKCAIQNAPNPGGGDLQKAGKLSPLKVQPKKFPCRGQTTCRGSCDSGELSRSSGTFSSQIENTPILCPFHLQPVPEPETVLKNQEVEFGRNRERLQFFKWSSGAFKNVAVIPPGTGMAHQVNLEYLSRVVFEEKDLFFPDSVVGTDSHITMVNGLGILGWGVGGIETEAVMLGLPVTLTLPEVVGCELTGSSNAFVTSIDIVLGITKHLRQVGVAGKFVEFFGSGVSQLSIADRTTIANMCPEYGAILSFFPVDNVTLRHLEHTGFDKTKLESMEKYLKAVKLFRNDENSSEPEYSQVIQINLNSIVASVSGPKRPQDRVAVTDMKSDFQACLNEKVGFKGFQVAAEKQSDTVSIHYDGSEYKLSHGSVVIAAVISCTNNCNPSVMLAAGLLAKKAVETGLRVKPYIRTSLSPGSGMVTHYLSSSGVLPYLSKLGFEIVGYGCSTCVGNTAPLSEAVLNAVKQEMVLPGFPDADSFVKFALGSVVAVTKASGGLPQFGDEYDFYRSFPAFQAFCETQGDRLLQCMSRVMQYHGCRSNIKDRSKVTELEDKFDLLVDTNDVILERVGILLDEASGVNKHQQPVLPAGLQVPKTIVSSWNRKAGEYGKKAKSETFRLLHAKNILRPQLRFREKIDNSNTPFLPKIFVKPNARKPLPQALSKERRERPQDRPEDLDVPPALADLIHQQRTQQVEQDMFAHPYQYELDHFTPPDSVLQKPQPQLYRPVGETPCHFVSSLDQLVELNEKLLGCQEFAVDLEHHSYRSFLGLTCLMQISTRTEDFIVDTLELRSDMYILNESLTDPAIVKVFHGADSDIEWLQKDFGLYVVNMFDTHQAARLLNLARHSLDHLLRLYCGVESNKQYQLADWRIRPLPEEMLNYARDDTHYLLYIYDRMRLELWERGNDQPVQLQVVWQRSRDICLKKFVKPIFTDESYLELYRKQKKHLNSQQLAAFQLLFAWRDKTARREDESYGYVLPNHMMLKIAEELPKEPQGIIACCNPVPPLVRQQINEMHLLIQQAREMPLLKSEAAAGVKKSGPLPAAERLENDLFGPHDCSHAPPDNYPIIPTDGSVPLQKQPSLFAEGKEGTSLDATCLLATAVITLFSEPSAEESGKTSLTVAQKKAQNILESFENPFRMFLPSLEHKAHISQAAKFDPSSKIYEISNRWKLASQVQKEPKEATAKKAPEQTAAQKQAKEESEPAALEQAIPVRQQAVLENAAKKRERATSDLRTTEQKQEKKRLKSSKKPKDPDPAGRDFSPYDYSQSDFRAFAGDSKSKPSSQFDPNKPAPSGKKCVAAKKFKQSVGNKSMSFPAGKSDRGFRHNWPKR